MAIKLDFSCQQMKINRGDFSYYQFISGFYFTIFSRLVAFGFILGVFDESSGKSADMISSVWLAVLENFWS